MLAFDGAVTVDKFNAKEGDALSRWSMRRAEGISLANLSAAKYVQDSGRTWSSNGWYFNPYYGMYTFIPGGRGVFSSPYGYRYYSPMAAYHFFYQRVASYAGQSSGYNAGGYNSNLGYRTAAPTSSGYSGVMASAPAATSAGAAPSGGGGSVSHSGTGGGRSR